MPTEYDILEQLKKTQARISIFDLINSSVLHRKALQEVLEQVQVALDMPVEDLHVIATAAFIEHVITFSDSELALPERRRAPLNVTISVNNHLVSGVLVDTGALMNICSLSTISTLGVNEASITPINMTIARYDDNKRKAHGKWTTKIGVGPTQVLTQLIVIDMNVLYQIILGWQ